MNYFKRMLEGTTFLSQVADPPAGGGGAPPVDPGAGNPPADPKAGDPPAPKAGDPPKAPEPKAGDPPKADDKAKEGEKSKDPNAKTDNGIDVKTLTLPEGFKTDEKTMQGLVETLSNAELTPQARAQALVDLHANALKAAQETATLAWDNVTKEWHKSISADKELGSSPLKPEVKAVIAKALDQFGSPETKEALDITGAGNNPHIVKIFYKMAKLLTEGSHKGGNPPSGNQQKTAASVLYPDNPSAS